MAMTAAALAFAGLLQAGPGTCLVTGELSRLDLGSRRVTVKSDRKDAGEVDFAVDAETRIVSRGRVLRLTDLRAGEPVTVVCVEQGGGRRARVVKAGASRYAAPPEPSRRP
jgi:hypothetical protein